MCYSAKENNFHVSVVTSGLTAQFSTKADLKEVSLFCRVFNLKSKEPSKGMTLECALSHKRYYLICFLYEVDFLIGRVEFLDFKISPFYMLSQFSYLILKVEAMWRKYPDALTGANARKQGIEKIKSNIFWLEKNYETFEMMFATMQFIHSFLLILSYVTLVVYYVFNHGSIS